MSSHHHAAPALYCEPVSRDFGQHTFGQRGFGGLLEDWTTPRPDGKTRWIPQYNLQNFWRRKIPPLQCGLIEPLIPPRLRSPDDFSRLPGHFSYRTTNDYELYNRNLLATRFFENSGGENGGGILKIWTVNERSKRKMLECFSVEISPLGLPITASSSLQPIYEKKLKMLPPLKNDTAAPKAKEPLLELRTSSWSSPLHTGLFLRSPTLLQLMNFREEEASSEEDPVIYEKHIPIFNFAVKSFTESELLEQTLAVVDFGGRVWICGGGGGFSSKPMKLRANEQEIYQLAAFCDHPKLIAVAGHFHVEIVDMRSPAAAASSRACAELWRSPLFESRGREEAMYLQAVPPVSAQIRHVSRLQGTANAYCVMTDRTLHLIDDRFPGRPVLGLKHAFSSGTHRMVVSNPVGDEAAGGNVYSIFCQDQLQVLNSSISMTKLYAHPTGVWSSVDAFHSIGEPENFNQIVRRGKYAEPEVPSEPTRAMDLVELSDLKCSLLVRQTDDGAIWWQKFSNEPVRTEKEQFSEQKKSLERIIERRSREPDSWKREPWRPVYSDGMCEEVREKPEDFRKIVPVSCPDIDRRVISKYNQYATTLSQQANRFRISSHLIKQPLEVIPLDDINSTLSKITLDTWQATENMMKENRQKQ